MSILRFSFGEKEHCSYGVNKLGMRAHFECVEPHIAHMYFTNAKGEYMDIPQNDVHVYRHIGGTNKVIHPVTDPLLEQIRNKNKTSRTGYLYTYYVLNQNEEYEIGFKYITSSDASTSLMTSLRSSIARGDARAFDDSSNDWSGGGKPPTTNCEGGRKATEPVWDDFINILKLVPQNCWKIENHHLVNSMVHS